jgi:hypothetical protein
MGNLEIELYSRASQTTSPKQAWEGDDGKATPRDKITSVHLILRGNYLGGELGLGTHEDRVGREGNRICEQALRIRSQFWVFSEITATTLQIFIHIGEMYSTPGFVTRRRIWSMTPLRSRAE